MHDCKADYNVAPGGNVPPTASCVSTAPETGPAGFASGSRARALPPAFYLKVNIDNDYTVKYLEHWVQIAEALGADYYVLCDNDALMRRILDAQARKGECQRKHKFIASRNERLQACKEVFPLREATGCALLTPFVHAHENGFANFWNVDADDTIMLCAPDVCAKILKGASDCAEQKRLDAFSLDMWYSRNNGTHWSFGVTYTTTKADHIKIVEDNISLYHRLCASSPERTRLKNIDEFFSNMRIERLLKLETFYVENMYFDHRGKINTWRNGEVIYNYVVRDADGRAFCKKPIAADCVKLDFGLGDQDSSPEFREQVLKGMAC